MFKNGVTHSVVNNTNSINCLIRLEVTALTLSHSPKLVSRGIRGGMHNERYTLITNKWAPFSFKKKKTFLSPAVRQ